MNIININVGGFIFALDTGAAGEQGDGGEQARPAPSQIAPWSTWSGARRPNRTTLMDQRVRVTRLP